jgi:hypothetical protein
MSVATHVPTLCSQFDADRRVAAHKLLCAEILRNIGVCEPE